MRPILIGVGLVLALCGAIGLVFGLEISDIERGQTQAIVGAVALTGGILTMAMALLLGKLDEIASHLASGDLRAQPRFTGEAAPVAEPTRTPPAGGDLFGTAATREEKPSAPSASVDAPEVVEDRDINAEMPEPKRPSVRPSISLSTFGRPRSLATPTLPPAPPPIPADAPRDPSDVAAAAVAAAIDFPPNFDFAPETAPAPAEPEDATETPDQPTPPAEPTATKSSAFGAAFSRQLSEKAAASRYDPFSFDARSRPLSEPSSSEAIAPPPPPPEPLPPAVPEAPEPRPAESSAFTLRPVAEAPTPERLAPDPARFPLRSMTLPRGAWPEAPPPPAAEPEAAETEQAPAPTGDWFERALSGFDEPPLPDLTLRSTTAAAPSGDTMAEPQQDAPPTAAEPDVVGRYESNGATYVMYADGSIDAETETGTWRFASLTELKAYIESRNTDLG